PTSPPPPGDAPSPPAPPPTPLDEAQTPTPALPRKGGGCSGGLPAPLRAGSRQTAAGFLPLGLLAAGGLLSLLRRRGQ
ncbi:MAG: hypothetical protein HY680_04400, partial [Chloroflexi bacterium]|nr:hypothetical protein [Chloroflexota bacterium]